MGRGLQMLAVLSSLWPALHEKRKSTSFARVIDSKSPPHSTQVVQESSDVSEILYVCSVLGVNFRRERLRKSSGRSDLAKGMANWLCWPSLGRICPQRLQHAWWR